MPDIKTRAVAEKAVKTIDKSAIAAQRMKNAYVQAKEKAERTRSVSEESPEEYAADYISDGTAVTAYEVEVTKENIAKAKEYFQNKRLTGQPKMQTPAQVNRVSAPAKQQRTNIKPVKRGRKTIKQSAKSAGKTAVKTAKGNVKAASKSVKTAKTTGRAAVKISQQTARTARQTAQVTVKTARSTVQATRVAARAVAATVKKAAQATITETTLYITVSHKTADEMADIYNFTADQRRQLAELLAEENNSIWSSVLYGIGTGDGEIVTVDLSQIGNVRGQPYWSLWLWLPCGVVCLLCQLVCQRVRVSGCWRDSKIRRMRQWGTVFQRSGSLAK